MKMTPISKLLTALALGIGAGQAVQGGITQLSIGYDTDYAVDMSVQGYSVHGYATAFSASRVSGDPLPAGHTDPFITFCLDINQGLDNGYWKSGGFSDTGLTSQSGPTTRQANSLFRAANLYRTFGPGANTSTTPGKFEGAALALAIWEVLYETAGSYDVNSGVGFSVTTGDTAVRTRANVMLATASSINFSLTTTFWNATDALGNTRGSQDLIGPMVGVPEASTYALAGLLCIPIAANGIRLFRRRSFRAS